MKPSPNCIDLIKKFEGCRLEAYKDVAGIWTIGYGTIMYPDGKKVKEGEVTDLRRAEAFLTWEVELKSQGIDKLLTPVILTQNQFDSLVSFAYNAGINAFKGSTLLKKVRNNPQDPTIRDAFMAWNKARVKGVLQEIKGLTLRRKAESDLYFT